MLLISFTAYQVREAELEDEVALQKATLAQEQDQRVAEAVEAAEVRVPRPIMSHEPLKCTHTRLLGGKFAEDNSASDDLPTAKRAGQRRAGGTRAEPFGTRSNGDFLGSGSIARHGLGPQVRRCERSFDQRRRLAGHSMLVMLLTILGRFTDST